MSPLVNALIAALTEACDSEGICLFLTVEEETKPAVTTLGTESRVRNLLFDSLRIWEGNNE